MIKRLTQAGNSYAVVIDKPILELLHISPQTELRVSTDGRSLTLTPVNAASDAEFKAAHTKVLKQHAKTFRKLADPSE